MAKKKLKQIAESKAKAPAQIAAPQAAAEAAAGRGDRSRSPFPVVAVGASAGGLAAFTAFLQELPGETGLAFVLVQHLEPKHESVLSELLTRSSSMPVIEVVDGITVEPNHIYVIPPNRNMAIHGDMLRLSPRKSPTGIQRTIDDFFISLAESRGSASIGVILSGTGSDGTNGSKAIRAAGGVTFAQNPESAEWPAMPASAISSGSIDFILSPAAIAAELVRIGGDPYLAGGKEVPEGNDLDKMCLLLRASVGIDFTLYKAATVRRRIARRMALLKIDSPQKYINILKQSPEEAQALADDIFIHVTSFFRDPECFEALRTQVLARLKAQKAEGEPLRVWVAGCSTGEEVYSIAMLLLEELGDQIHTTKLQFFGTDIQEAAVDHARAGVYSEAGVAGVSPARLKRFFVKLESGYQIHERVRELCVFARHNLAKDPPFSRLDLVSCRNVLIYMGAALQKRVLAAFQYALNPGGFLFLGNSESISDYSDVFAAQDRENRIFVRKPSGRFRGFNVETEPMRALGDPAPAAAPLAVVDFRQEAEKLLLEHYAPPALVVDPDLHITHFQGDTSPYLAPATGQPSFHLLKMVRPELVVDLRSAIYKARRHGTAVHKDGVRLEETSGEAEIRIDVRPLKKRNAQKQDFLIVFQRSAPPSDGHRAAPGSPAGRKATGAAADTSRLERDLNSTREQLRGLISEHETAQEEMKAANEELLSSNEELQSTNEELETAKEELQSSNEELITLNDELQYRNTELNVLTYDLNNLLVGVDLPVLVLDAELRVRRFTPVAGELLNLIPGDVGRPFHHIASNLDISDWPELFWPVIKHGRTVEREVRNRGGHRYSLRVRPYRIHNDEIGGVLVVLLDTDLIYRARDEAQKSADYSRAIIETIHEGLVVVDAEHRILSANQSFCELFQVTSGEIRGRSFWSLCTNQKAVAELQSLLQETLNSETSVTNMELHQDFAGAGVRQLVLNARQIDASRTILIAIEDATERRRAQAAAESSQATMHTLLESSPQSVVTVDGQGAIVMVNGNTESMFKYWREELLGQSIEVLLPDAVSENGSRGPEYFTGLEARSQTPGLSLEGRRKDGEMFPVELSHSRIETPQGIFSVIFISDITQRRLLERVAEEQTKAVHALASSLIVAQEEERRRVSRELHDQICQQLASLAIDMGGLIASPLPQKIQTRLRKLQSRAVKASELARHLAYELHPSVLDDLGLVASLKNLCKEFTARTGILVDLSSGTLPRSIPIEIASCLYRVAQESLQNVAKHSQAKNVAVEVVLEGEKLAMVIADDGVGFNLQHAKGRGGLGLIGMEERAHLVHGTFTLTTAEGKGTRIELVVPVPAEL